ncbi:hypothetical protein J3486_42955, partial [Streptomyces sp. VRA16 Mangrove soil]|nr:hypothetical protein [Streptomyces sp. VRA16 Mangrove soil]
MSQQGERPTGRRSQEDDWWGQLYGDDADDATGAAADTGPTLAADTLDDRFASAGAVVTVPQDRAAGPSRAEWEPWDDPPPSEPAPGAPAATVPGPREAAPAEPAAPPDIGGLPPRRGPDEPPPPPPPHTVPILGDGPPTYE